MKRFCLGIATFAFMCFSFVWAQGPTEFKGHDGLIHSVAISPDGTLLATAGVDGLIKIWDYAAGKEKFVLKGHTGTVNSVAFNKDGTLLASGGADKGIRTWNPKEGKPVKEFPKGHADGVSAVAFSPDGKLLASVSGDKSVKLWDVDGAKELKTLGSHKDSVYGVAFNKDGTQLVSSGNDGIIMVWDVKAMTMLKSMMVDLPKKEIKIVEPPKDKDKDKKPKKDAGKKEEPKELRDAFTAVAFTPDGKSVLSVGHDKYLRYWDLGTGKETKKLGPTPDWIFGLAISKDGKEVVTAGYGGSLRVFDIQSGTQLYPSPEKEKTEAADKARRGWITYSVVFAPDGKSVITGSDKGGKGIAKVTPLVK